MKKVGILGGTFNPPHQGHLIIANEVCHSLGLDEIWFMPNQEPPHKRKAAGAPDEHRLGMLEAAITGNKLFKVEKAELERPGPSYTYDTMRILAERYPGHRFYFIIGADMVEYLPKWHKIGELLKLVAFVGVQRPGYSLETPYPVETVEVPAIDLSSSMIRDRLHEGKTIQYLLPDSVISYIWENKLYGT
ncbi:nicotinic acid mononucleotide adenylyltransferase [Neobacillus piezotolerans]|uniref:Probable nicotinate-nucleotide adenylyltransferase n=1 Tax=Neobacillus piezotolerans TaxID=2259171 RepID=A0A3D8GLW1_9BACI|nr:nicotinate-nucleotide adenylyltransferase [Neobacillus piezotolerans]RDU35454.1 nicotinic acid mononucleotide adenylyltransferase [Neobacillus piezotolerans]